MVPLEETISINFVESTPPKTPGADSNYKHTTMLIWRQDAWKCLVNLVPNEHTI